MQKGYTPKGVELAVIFTGVFLVFGDKEKSLLNSMRINPTEYYEFLEEKFGKDAIEFSKLLANFDDERKVGDTSEFNEYWKAASNNEPCEGDLCNYLYELYNNLLRFYHGGVFKLFKKKQAEWGAPEIIIITKQDVPNKNDIEQLNEPQTIYRGLNPEEHKIKNYFQSWTTSLEKAKEFANDVYTYQPSGIVVRAEISKSFIIHYSADDSEKEVIIEKGAISFAEQI